MHSTASLMIVALLVIVATTALALGGAIQRLRSTRRGAPPAELPRLLVIRPVRGVDPGLDANLGAALAQEYPGHLETLFILDDESDPALPAIERAIASHPGIDARVVLAGALHPMRTGKLHAMIRGMAAAEHDTELVCFADSDTRPGPELLRELAHAVVRSPKVGAAFARAVCAEPARTPWDVAHGVMLDALYGPQAALAMVRRGSLPFIMGQTMILRRSALRAAGGLEASEGQLVDDMHIGRRLAAAGYLNVLSPEPLPLVSSGLSWPAFSSLAVRWIAYSRTGIPFWPFNVPTTLLTGAFVAGVLGALVTLVVGDLRASAGFFCCALSVVVSVALLRRLHGGAPARASFWWATPVFVALLPIFFLRAQLSKAIEWRGRKYTLDRGGFLLKAPAP